MHDALADPRIKFIQDTGALFADQERDPLRLLPRHRPGDRVGLIIQDPGRFHYALPRFRRNALRCGKGARHRCGGDACEPGNISDCISHRKIFVSIVTVYIFWEMVFPHLRQIIAPGGRYFKLIFPAFLFFVDCACFVPAVLCTFSGAKPLSQM